MKQQTGNSTTTKTEQEVQDEVFHTNAYPLDKDANKGLCTTIKALSAAIIAVETFISYQLVKHIYEYVTQIHREPDTVLLMSLIYLFVSFMKMGLCAYGFNFASKHTERTQQNYNGLFKQLNVASFLKIASSTGIYAFLTYHVQQYSLKYGEIETDVHDYINILKNLVSAQMIASIVYHTLISKLHKNETTQPKIVDQKAAAIKLKQ
eukprot:403356069